jgi:prevent-host-death family protein
VSEVTIRELRNQGGKVVDRVMAGERVTVTRDGKPVAELRPLGRPPVSAETLLQRWHRLPNVDPAALRRDVDVVAESSV